MNRSRRPACGAVADLGRDSAIAGVTRNVEERPAANASLAWNVEERPAANANLAWNVKERSPDDVLGRLVALGVVRLAATAATP